MNICPQINDYFVVMILSTLASFFNDKFYERLYADILVNCFVRLYSTINYIYLFMLLEL